MLSIYVYRTLNEHTKSQSISYMQIHTCENINIGQSSLYDLFPLIVLATTKI